MFRTTMLYRGPVTTSGSFSTADRIIVSSGAGKAVKESPVSIDSSGNVSGVADLTVTGQVRLSQQPVTAPALRLQAGEETGITSAAAGSIALVRSGTEYLRLDSGGLTLYQGTYIRPGSSNIRDLGAAGLVWRNGYINKVISAGDAGGIVFEVPSDTGAVGTHYGRIPITVTGVGTKYIDVFD